MMKRALAAALLCLLVSSCVTPQPSRPPLQVALTFDDLTLHGPYPPGETPLSVERELVAALKREHVRNAYGMVNGHSVEEQPATDQALSEWRSAGLLLGNHGWSHRHLNEMTAAEFEQELTRNEPLLQRHATGTDWHWFRYPFLDEGGNTKRRAEARAVLARHGYRVASVTMDFGDWQWTGPYARCAGDPAAVAKLEAMYLQAAREGIDYFRTLSRQLYGRDIPYVILLHESAFEARMLPQLLQIFRQEGFRFVSVAQAEKDPAYADQVDPAAPALPQGLEDKARDRNIALPKRTNLAPLLDAMCKR